MIRNTVNMPRRNNLWDFFGLGYVYGASANVEVRE